MYRYKSGQIAKIGDKVLISQAMAQRLNIIDRHGVVVGLKGFITVRLLDGDYDFDARSVTFVERSSPPLCCSSSVAPPP